MLLVINPRLKRVMKKTKASLEKKVMPLKSVVSILEGGVCRVSLSDR